MIPIRGRLRAAISAAWPYLAPIAVVALEWPLLSPMPAVADNFQFWAAGHLVASGASPYDRAAWEGMAAYGPVAGGVALNTVPRNLRQTAAVWLYPPQTAFVFAPFGALPLSIGVPLLHFAVIAAAAGGVVLAARAVGLRGARLAFVLTLAAISQPFVIVVRNGHPDGLVLAGLALTFLGLRDQRAWQVAAGAVLVSIKPQIALAFVLAAVAYVIAHRDIRALAAAVGAVAAATIPAWSVHPFPIASLFGSTDQRLGLDLSTTAALARDLGGGVALTLSIAALSLGAAAYALRAARPAARAVVAFGSLTALSLVVAPYVHDYDELLALTAALAAAAIAAGTKIELRVVPLVAILVAAVPWLLFFWWPLLGQGDRPFQGGALGALPPLELIFLAAVVRLRRPERGSGVPQYGPDDMVRRGP